MRNWTPHQRTFTIPDKKGTRIPDEAQVPVRPRGPHATFLNRPDTRRSHVAATEESSCGRCFADTFDLPISANVRLRVTDLLGRELAILIDGD